MNRINKQSDDISELPSLLNEVRDRLRYHTESGFTKEEANAYAQQLDDIEKVLIPEWKERLRNTTYEVLVESSPNLDGFLKIKVIPAGSKPIEVFAESYGHYNAEMCDGSCYQYVYQKVLCYQEGLNTGRVPL